MPARQDSCYSQQISLRPIYSLYRKREVKKPVDCCWSETFFKEMWFQAVSNTFRMVGSLSALDSVNREFGYGTWKKNSGGIWRVQELSWKVLRQNCHGHLRYQISLAWRRELAYGVMPLLLFVAKGKMLLDRVEKLVVTCFPSWQFFEGPDLQDLSWSPP